MNTIDIDTMSDYIMEPARNAGVRNVIHNECGTPVAAIPATEFSIGKLLTVVRRHDCSVGALIAQIPSALKVATIATGFLDGSDDVDEEYLRAMTELVTEIAGLPLERKAEVGAYLWEQADTCGPTPAYVHTW